MSLCVWLWLASLFPFGPPPPPPSDIASRWRNRLKPQGESGETCKTQRKKEKARGKKKKERTTKEVKGKRAGCWGLITLDQWKPHSRSPPFVFTEGRTLALTLIATPLLALTSYCCSGTLTSEEAYMWSASFVGVCVCVCFMHLSFPFVFLFFFLFSCF